MNTDQTLGVGIGLMLIGIGAACVPWVPGWWKRLRNLPPFTKWKRRRPQTDWALPDWTPPPLHHDPRKDDQDK